MAKKKDETAQDEPLTESVEYVKSSNDTPQVYAAMMNVMADLDAITKTKKSSGVSFAFRGIDDVMNALHPSLVRHGVFVTPLLESMENKVFEQDKTNNQGQVVGKRNMFQAILTCRFRFYALDGSYVDAVVGAESSDYSDKSTQQALSYCFKAAMLQTFCIPTQDTTDGDERTPEDTSGKKVAPAAASKLKDMPRLSDRPSIAEMRGDGQEPAAPITQDDVLPPKAPVNNFMTEADWGTVKNVLVPLNVSDKDFNLWVVKTLKAAGLAVPKKMTELPKTSGKTLWQTAAASVKAGQLLYEIAPAE